MAAGAQILHSSRACGAWSKVNKSNTNCISIQIHMDIYMHIGMYIYKINEPELTWIHKRCMLLLSRFWGTNFAASALLTSWLVRLRQPTYMFHTRTPTHLSTYTHTHTHYYAINNRLRSPKSAFTFCTRAIYTDDDVRRATTDDQRRHNKLEASNGTV